MRSLSDIALHALCAATVPADAERAAARCERDANNAPPGSANAGGYSLAAKLLRDLAQTVSRKPHGIHVSYRGMPVRVDRTKIPGSGLKALASTADDGSAALLFYDAIKAGALDIPGELRVELYGDSTLRGGFVLVAYTRDSPARGVTRGWREVENIVGHSVEDALEFMVAELNSALGIRGGGQPAARIAVAARTAGARGIVRLLVDNDPRFVFAEEARRDAREFARLADSHLAAVVIELRSPRGYALRDLAVLTQTLPGTPVVVFAGPGAPTNEALRPFTQHVVRNYGPEDLLAALEHATATSSTPGDGMPTPPPAA